ncbi:UDP-N-acetylmuramoyl-L-alanyl-D-glutamate--2,6-diaminopimelate ligase [Lactobacillus sp. Sy-1]|uniref:UDP-N-acetylmuramoyl-L-alanyl-D-glutamate--2, 6-diaminopimelate ligase n=1 Tax=Lactobacillus sp. Sy-1 TaxID=2109645 RepID=UPI001C58654E|nr:UDP-N-acetylmuramoyl-L-alanyl-D-glutamate--2,6-diaminopimelate ligase [Lactobacillus sp. Sy-1]MBW1605724.1 UDP-N-acetylmuramoyl-L-alanyl-D-glutamate--2,6-diaminopimelate ligase [Lactobacillus sp. Sy-1]
MALKIEAIITLLKEHDLLKKVSGATTAVSFTNIEYDSRQVQDSGLFCCKGNFKPEYLTKAAQNGASGYLAEREFTDSALLGIIVTDVQKAMALLGAAFYGYPQNDLFIIAYTGTKGKTTSAYFTHATLADSTSHRTALFSTIDTVVGPDPEQRFKSHLTTPESLDVFKNMRAAVDNGMTHLVMEVSSQAYKKNRVYGLHFDVGIFLNISPDHIGANEHPTFADYLHCKEQLLVNSTVCIINAETDHLTDVYQTAKATSQPEAIYLFARQGAQLARPLTVDFSYVSTADTLEHNAIRLTAETARANDLAVAGDYQLSIAGDYNESNATASIIAAGLAGATADQIARGLRTVLIPGRMESYRSAHHGTIYVDYAHNYASMHALLGFLKRENPAGRVIVVVGSPGNKGEDRREGFGKALSESADAAFLTTDDPAFEDPETIAREIDSYVDHDRVQIHFEMDRKQAIVRAIESAGPADMVVVAGKGRDPYQKVNGVDVPYETDSVVVKNILKGFKNNE